MILEMALASMICLLTVCRFSLLSNILIKIRVNKIKINEMGKKDKKSSLGFNLRYNNIPSKEDGVHCIINHTTV
jgi:hypothetical protein